MTTQSVFEEVFVEEEKGKALRGEERSTPSENVFEDVVREEEQDQAEFKESTMKSWLRTLYQVPSGMMQRYTYPMDIFQMMGMGSALDPDEIEHIRKISEREGIPFDEDKYRQAVSNAGASVPTQSNIEALIEEKTGAPLTPKTKLQKGIKLGSLAGTLSPGSLTEKGAAALTAPAVSTGLEALGVPEPIAEGVGLGASGVAAKVAPKVKTVTKPSGLPTRRFEKLKEPRVVSPKKLGKIHEKLETDFKKISNEIIEDSPISKTVKTLEENPAFKSEVAEQFKKVEELAEKLPEKMHTKSIKKALLDKISKKEGTGFSPSEYDKDYNKFMKQFIKETPLKEIKAIDGVKQFRKNNKSLSEAYDPSKSRAFNRAKKDALLDYNRAIADVMEQTFPNSEFSNLFKETNTQWGQILDVEGMHKFIDGMFDGGVNFKKGRKFFENANQARPFKRALGPEQFGKFEQLMKDMLSTEKPAKMLQIAKQKGFGELVKTAGTFIIHPTIGKIKLTSGIIKETYHSLVNSLLDKPQLMLTWEKGVKALNKGKFSEAEKMFAELDKEVKAFSKKEKALQKYNARQKK